MEENSKTFAYYSLAWLQKEIKSPFAFPADICSPVLTF